MTNAIQIEHLSVSLDHKPILNDISATAAEGSVIGLLGPSGSGKTTLIRAILGLQKPRSGSIKVLGLVAGAPKLHRLVGYVTQSPSVYPDLTVRENLDYFAKLLGAPRGQVTTILSQVELTENARQLVANLSGGQRTRVSLAAAMLGNPQLLLLDEPTVGLDPVLRAKLWEIFHRLARAGVTIVISSHVMDEADKCDEILFLRDGSVLASGSPKSILTQTGTKNMEQAFLKLAQGDAK